MGCDIHLWVEEQDEGGTWWPVFELKAQCRDYALFGLMAGVRGYDYLFPAGGFPSDASWLVRQAYEGETDVHTPSWLVARDFLKCLNKLRVLGYDIGSCYKALGAMLEGFDGPSRIVFWFDG